MKIDFLHNRIVAETITDGFKEAVMSSVAPAIAEKYGDALVGVQMYSDYLSSKLSYGKTGYYPLSVKTVDGVCVEWMCWPIKKGCFIGNSPFGYIGDEPLEIALCDEPSCVDKPLNIGYFDENTVKLSVETAAPDITLLSGKYSQSFVDEMARQLTSVISDAFGISGLEDSSIELALVFAPETYMEHTSDNVTYRRLLFVDRGCAPRDFWIKWTRLSGEGAYSMSDEVSEGDILFELGENVPQKIKEKEYRFLTKAGKDEYHTAMGRKNVTEWRIVLKRAIKRGDLALVNKPITLVKDKNVAPEAKVSAPVEEIGFAAPVASSADETEISDELFMSDEETSEENVASEAEEIINSACSAQDEDDELAAVMEMARRALSDLNGEEATVAAQEKKAPVASYVSDEESREIDEITRMALEALKLAESGSLLDDERDTDASVVNSPLEEAEPVDAEPTCEADEIEFEDELVIEDDLDGEPSDEIEFEDMDELSDEESEEDLTEALEEDERIADEVEASDEFVPVIVPDDPTEEEYAEGEIAPVVAEENISADSAREADDGETLEEKIRREIEAKLRLEYESEAKRKAEAEAERLRLEQERLVEENRKLQEAARRSREEWQRQEEERLAEAEKLKAQIEAKLRQEAKERERLAEAARLAIEEQQRLEAEKLRAERERLEREIAEREARRAAEEAAAKERERQAELLRIEAERAKVQPTPEKAPENRYTYISKTVTLMFRKSVDPNMVTRIHEILKATLEYYGKQSVHMRIKASIPNSATVRMEFLQFPKEEMELLGNMIKVLGNSNLGIAKAIVD